MKITLIQQDIIWADPRANRQAFGSALLDCVDSDVCILPEMWSTGFCTAPDNLPAEEQEETLRWLQKMAEQTDCAIVGSMAIQAKDGTWRNRLHFTRPHMQQLFYDKHHLFTYGGEQLHYTAGQERLLVEWRGVRFMPLICYDLRFPIWSRNRLSADREQAEYDVLIYIASWPSSRAKAWKALLTARAIENQCYVCGVNRIGKDPLCSYSGGTVCIDPYGNVVAQAQDDENGKASIEIDMTMLRNFRKKFPVLQDRD